MINYNTEYFRNNCYFFLKDRGDKISLYYTIAETLTESRKKDERKDFDKKHEKKLKRTVNKILNTKGKVSKKQVDKELTGVENGEIDELIDSDGTMLSSKVPPINSYLHPKKTMDQTVASTRVTNDPVTRGYRVYWGEGEDKEGEVMSEVDFSDAFGYEETLNKDYKETVKTLKDMGTENPVERAKQFGKLPKAKRKNGKLKQRLSEKETLEEIQKQKMIKMIEDVISKKKSDDSDVINKETPISKILSNNLKSIKKIAEKEGISLSDLIKALKKDE